VTKPRASVPAGRGAAAGAGAGGSGGGTTTTSTEPMVTVACVAWPAGVGRSGVGAGTGRSSARGVGAGTDPGRRGFGTGSESRRRLGGVGGSGPDSLARCLAARRTSAAGCGSGAIGIGRGGCPVPSRLDSSCGAAGGSLLFLIGKASGGAWSGAGTEGLTTTVSLSRVADSRGRGGARDSVRSAITVAGAAGAGRCAALPSGAGLSGSTGDVAGGRSAAGPGEAGIEARRGDGPASAGDSGTAATGERGGTAAGRDAASSINPSAGVASSRKMRRGGRRTGAPLRLVPAIREK
jgi:hypothetical protein